mgnify:FL=1
MKIQAKIIPSKNVVVLMPPEDQKTKSGIVLPDTENKTELGVVYLIGEGKKPCDFSVGDSVVFRKYTDNRVFVEGQEFNFVRFNATDPTVNDILAVVKLKK